MPQQGAATGVTCRYKIDFAGFFRSALCAAGRCGNAATILRRCQAYGSVGPGMLRTAPCRRLARGRASSSRSSAKTCWWASIRLWQTSSVSSRTHWGGRRVPAIHLRIADHVARSPNTLHIDSRRPRCMGSEGNSKSHVFAYAPVLGFGGLGCFRRRRARHPSKFLMLGLPRFRCGSGCSEAWSMLHT